MSKKIGFIGIGLMGLPMAKNILKAGFNLKAFNRSQNKAEPLKESGAEIASSIDDVVKDSDVVITMLTDDMAINDVMENPNFLENLKSGSTVIDMSSVKPTTATKHGNNFKSKNINYLDAPVSGGTIGAEEGSLAIMVGGEQNVFYNVVDVFQTMGNPTLVGPVGSGQVSKLANQIIVGLTIGAVAEASNTL
jgi:2-hydroxy-3-oxopropionate reductase